MEQGHPQQQTKQGFFNPWDERVRIAIERAEERRQEEIRERLGQVKQESRAEKHAVLAEAPSPSAVPASNEPAKARAGVPNSAGLRCPICGGIPKMLRGDGKSVSRHLPAKPDAKKYRDTEFCDGQGRAGVA